MNNDFAPIGLSVYSRLAHVKKTVESLRNNRLAADSELHIFSDAAKAGDEVKVQAVREFLKTIDGFKSVCIYERELNNRVANNRGGIRMLLEKHGKIIFLEEDSVVSEFFLLFMNEALCKYVNDMRVLAITAYSYPFMPVAGCTDFAYLSRRMFCYGFAIWNDRFNMINMDIPISDYLKIKFNPVLSKKYREYGDDALVQLRHLVLGKIDALDVRMDYTMWKRSMAVVLPFASLLKNTGHDGTGEHWSKPTDKFSVKLFEKQIFLEDNICYDPRLTKKVARFHRVPVQVSLKIFVADILMCYSLISDFLLKRIFKRGY